MQIENVVTLSRSDAKADNRGKLNCGLAYCMTRSFWFQELNIPTGAETYWRIHPLKCVSTETFTWVLRGWSLTLMSAVHMAM